MTLAPLFSLRRAFRGPVTTLAAGTLIASSLSACASDSSAEKPQAEEASGATAAEQPATAESVAYYSGPSQASSPDGATMFGPPTTSVVMRTLKPSEGVIVEDVHQGNERHLTTLTRRGDSLVFDATDEAKSFTGTLTFASDPFSPGAWTYAITMADGSGTIEGQGSLDDVGIHTNKTFKSPDGEARVRITEELKSIDEAAYDAAISTATSGEAAASSDAPASGAE